MICSEVFRIQQKFCGTFVVVDIGRFDEVFRILQKFYGTYVGVVVDTARVDERYWPFLEDVCQDEPICGHISTNLQHQPTR